MKTKFALMIMLIVVFLAGCTPSNKTDVSLSMVYYVLRNTPSDWWNPSSTIKPALTYDFTLVFEGNLSASDIVSARVYLPNLTSYWTLDPSNFNGSTNRLRQSGFYWGNHIHELPIGNLRAEVELSNGTELEYVFTMGIPGHKTNNGMSYVYSADDGILPTYPGVSVAALRRPTISNHSISNSEINITFTVNDENVNNGWIYFYDAAGNYIGWTKYFRDAITGVCLDCLNTGSGFNHGESGDNSAIITNTDIFDADGNAISSSVFSTITQCRLVVVDGAQYETSTSYSHYDYISFSGLTILSQIRNSSTGSVAKWGNRPRQIGENPIVSKDESDPDLMSLDEH